MVIRVISLVKITSIKTISLSKEIVDMLEVNYGDKIFYVLNKNGIVNIRKFKSDIILAPGEEYLSDYMVFRVGNNFAVTIANTVMQTIDADIGDNILLVIDSNRNIIIRHTFLSSICSTDILNKNISALIIGIATLVEQLGYISYQAVLPKNVRELLGIDEGDIFVLSLDESDNIVINQKIVKNLIQDTKLISLGRFSISEETRNILNVVPGDKILWIIDEDGNIIMRDAILSDNCII